MTRQIREDIGDAPITISSRNSFALRFILPALWIVGFGAVTMAMWAGVLLDKHGAPPPEPIKFGFLAIWTIGALSFYRLSNFMRVRMDDKFLYVSDFRREEQIPLQQIEDVRQSFWRSNQPVTVSLRAPCAFGDEFVFIPPPRFAFWRTHPVVEALRRRAGLPL